MILSLLERMRQRLAETNAMVRPVDADALLRVEATLGTTCPPLLRAIYLEIGNGGFGPGYGLLPLTRQNSADSDESVLELYVAFHTADPEDPSWSWPVQLLPVCDWGCAIRSCIDCSSAEGAVVTFDPNVRSIGEPMAGAFAETHASLHAWLDDWLDGSNIWDLMFEPDSARATYSVNPFTREPLAIVPTKLRRGRGRPK